MGDHCPAGLGADVENQPVTDYLNGEAIGPTVMAGRAKAIFLDQVIDGDRALVLDIARSRRDRMFVEQDFYQAL